MSEPSRSGGRGRRRGEPDRLTSAYEHGDLSRLYPIIRGTAPVLVAVVSVTVLGQRLGAA